MTASPAGSATQGATRLPLGNYVRVSVEGRRAAPSRFIPQRAGRARPTRLGGSVPPWPSAVARQLDTAMRLADTHRRGPNLGDRGLGDRGWLPRVALYQHTPRPLADGVLRDHQAEPARPLRRGEPRPSSPDGRAGPRHEDGAQEALADKPPQRRGRTRGLATKHRDRRLEQTVSVA